MNTMLRVLPSHPRDERYATTDRVILSDGQVIEVSRANLAAAKALLAAEKAAQRRLAAGRERTGNRYAS